MTDQEKIKARLENTEKVLFALIAVLEELQPPSMQEVLNQIMSEYFDANTSLGYDGNKDFLWVNS